MGRWVEVGRVEDEVESARCPCEQVDSTAQCSSRLTNTPEDMRTGEDIDAVVLNPEDARGLCRCRSRRPLAAGMSESTLSPAGEACQYTVQCECSPRRTEKKEG